MNSWGYANKIPTSVWRGSMTVPRYWCYIETSKPWFFKIWGFMAMPRYKWHRLGDSKSGRLCSVHFSNFLGSWQWPRWLGLTWCWATLSSNLNPSPRWKKIMSFSVIHHQTSRIIKYSSRYNHKQGFSISSAFRKYNPHSGWWRRGWTFLNPRPDVDHQWQFCTSGGNHLVFVCWIILELWSRQESESINMVDAVNIFEIFYQIQGWWQMSRE